MKIFWFSHRDIKHPRSGGAERTIYEVGKRLVSKGHQFIWYSVSWNGKTNSDLIDNINVVRARNNLIAHVMVSKTVRKIDPDVIVDDMGHAVPWGSENFTKIPGTVFFHHLHRRSLPGQVNFPLRLVITGLEASYPIIYRKWPFITESESSKKDLQSLGIDEKRILLIPPGVDPKWNISPAKTEYPSLVYFGGMRDYKRPWVVLYILKGVLKTYRNVQLFVAGAGPSLKRMTEICSNLGITQNVHFMGRIADDDLRSVVSSSWVNIHSSITEGFGFSILEASAAGTPTVAYSVPGVSEAIQNGMNGILVTDNDITSLTEAVIGILKSFPEEWIDNSKKVASKYTWEKTAEMWEKHLYSIVNERI